MLELALSGEHPKRDGVRSGDARKEDDKKELV